MTAALAASDDLLARLGSVVGRRGLPDLEERLADLSALVVDDMTSLEGALQELPNGHSVVHESAHHLLGQGGKRLRPMCVALAARCGSGFDHHGREHAVAVELVHNATLLHDDVVDLGMVRRGAPAARTIYGNAASIFAGDWLLVEALRRVRRCRVEGTLDRLLEIIEEMIFAEAIQLENRGVLRPDARTWFRVVEGKTAALFRWAMYAGARTGGLNQAATAALESFGQHLGVAFQAVDDLLDLTGDTQATGKVLFTDLREGKMTYPLIVAVEREPTLLGLLQTIVAGDGSALDQSDLRDQVRAALERTDAAGACKALARDHAAQAVEALRPIPASRAVEALVTVAEATVHRDA
ncbi:MAG TPA: polyprenyl synthetase family protein [Polyangiaceae bacterium LLY-WYZ-14_1]|nr:polyprenyl synthetase family protein [Polyangiaceae bacterium LLY-WYZ-14_1]